MYTNTSCFGCICVGFELYCRLDHRLCIFETHTGISFVLMLAVCGGHTTLFRVSPGYSNRRCVTCMQLVSFFFNKYGSVHKEQLWSHLAHATKLLYNITQSANNITHIWLRTQSATVVASRARNKAAVQRMGIASSTNCIADIRTEFWSMKPQHRSIQHIFTRSLPLQNRCREPHHGLPHAISALSRQARTGSDPRSSQERSCVRQRLDAAARLLRGVGTSRTSRLS